jgi:hypothetical protein
MIKIEQRFEGFTKGPWVFKQIDVPFGTEQIIVETSDGKTVIATIDWALVASAPELLEEVKRLRKESWPRSDSNEEILSFSRFFVENLPGINEAISFLKDSKLAEPWTHVPTVEKTVERLKCCGICNYYQPKTSYDSFERCKLKNNTIGWDVCEKWTYFGGTIQ